jgi:hypothetical protein
MKLQSNALQAGTSNPMPKISLLRNVATNAVRPRKLKVLISSVTFIYAFIHPLRILLTIFIFLFHRTSSPAVVENPQAQHNSLNLFSPAYLKKKNPMLNS